MKSMNKIVTKIAAALTTVMLFGGMAVFAAVPGDRMYSDTLTVTAKRSHWLVCFNYTGDNKTMTVDESGYYTISFNAQKPGDYPKSLLITSDTGRCVVDVSGEWNSYSLSGIYLEEGVNYNIYMYADDFVGFTFLQDKVSADFTVTATFEGTGEEEEQTPEVPEAPETPEIPEAPETPDEPEVPAMPEIVINEAPIIYDLYVDLSDMPETPDEETSAEAGTPAAPAITDEVEAEEDTPSVFTLTIEQIRMLSMKNFIGHLYLEGLGRNIKPEEMNYWMDKLNCGVSATEIATQILTSAEFNNKNLDNEALASVLNDVFDSTSDDTLAQLNSGASVESVIEQLAATDNWAS